MLSILRPWKRHLKTAISEIAAGRVATPEQLLVRDPRKRGVSPLIVSVVLSRPPNYSGGDPLSEATLSFCCPDFPPR